MEELFAKWGGSWIYLTYKNAPTKFLEVSNFHKLFDLALGLIGDDSSIPVAPPPPPPKTVASLHEGLDIAQEGAAAPDVDLPAAAMRMMASLNAAIRVLNNEHLIIADEDLDVNLQCKGWSPLRDLEVAANVLKHRRDPLVVVQSKLHDIDLKIARQTRNVEESQALGPDVHFLMESFVEERAQYYHIPL